MKGLLHETQNAIQALSEKKMKVLCAAAGMLVAVITPLSLKAQTMPKTVLEGLEAAKSTGNAYVLEAVKTKAIRDYPDIADAINQWGEEKPKPIQVQKVEAPKLSKNPWWKAKKGEIEASAHFSFGNSEEKEYFIKTSATHVYRDVENTFSFELQSSEEEGVRTEEEYKVQNQTRQNVSDRNYNFLELELEKDRFSGIQNRVSPFLGRGHTFVKQDDMSWAGELAGGYTMTKFTDATETAAASSRLASKFLWEITKSWTYKNLTKTTLTAEQAFTEFDNSIETKLMDHLSLRAAVDVDHDSDVPSGTKSTDIETRIGVVYGF